MLAYNADEDRIMRQTGRHLVQVSASASILLIGGKCLIVIDSLA